MSGGIGDVPTESTTDIRILHVDDDPDLCELTATFLERELDDVEHLCETSPTAALTRIEDKQVDCIISDYEMPEMDGLAFLEAVRNEHPDLPFILFTGKGSEEIASEAISAGVTDYLQKGTGTDQFTVLANRVQNAISQYRAEQEVEHRSKWYQRLLDHSSDYVMVVNGMGQVKYVSPAVRRVLGYEPNELIGSDSFENVHPEDLDYAADALTELIEDPSQEVTVEFRAEAADGTFRWLEVRGRNHLDDPLIEGVMVNVREIGERKTYEQRLEALNQTNQDLMRAETRPAVAEIGVEAAREIIGLEANSIHLHNDRARALEPVAASDAVNDLIGEPPILPDEESIAGRVYQDGDTLAIDNVHDDPDVFDPDTPVKSELHLPIEDYGILIAGSETAHAFDRQDIVLGELLTSNIASALEQVERASQVRARERELRQQNERLEEFASVVSHDLRNPLAVAQGRVELAQQECESDHLDDASHAIDRSIGLVDDLLTLAREGSNVAEVEPVDLAATVDSCWQNVQTGDATLTVESTETIQADSSRLKQLLENLMRNAVAHGGENVTVTVGGFDDGFYIADDGVGIPPAEREQVFEAGYSTSNEGTGFGLSIVQEIANAHGWEVRITESETGGTRFEFSGVTTAPDET